MSLEDFRKYLAAQALRNAKQILLCAKPNGHILQNKDELDIFKSIMDAKNEYSALLRWLKIVCEQIPRDYANILPYTLVRLRPI
jgi:hypothetical protein